MIADFGDPRRIMIECVVMKRFFWPAVMRPVCLRVIGQALKTNAPRPADRMFPGKHPRSAGAGDDQS